MTNNLYHPLPDDICADRRSANQLKLDTGSVLSQRAYFQKSAPQIQHSAFVLRGEVLVRTDAADGAAVDSIMSENQFTRTVSLGCTHLDGQLARYTPSDPTVRVDVPKAIEALDGVADASRYHFAAFQAPDSVGPNVVVKMEAGPFPTTVDDARVVRDASQEGPAGPVQIAIIDTGIEHDERSDDWLQAISRDHDIDPLDANPVDGRLDSAAGHGTFAAGIVQQIEPTADIRMYAALDSAGMGSEIAVACAMIQAVKDGAEIINMSLGIRTDDDVCPLAISTAFEIIDEWVRDNKKAPPVFVAAAGNFGDSRPVYPAAYKGVVSVAALTANGDGARWSTNGNWVTCSTIGEGIVSTYVQGKQSLDRGGTEIFPPDAWAVWTGTSFAAPQIAATIARELRLGRANGATPEAARDAVITPGTPLSGYGNAMRLLPGTAVAASS